MLFGREDAQLLGPLVGTLLLFATNASFYVVFAAVATKYLYFDLAARSTPAR